MDLAWSAITLDSKVSFCNRFETSPSRLSEPSPSSGAISGSNPAERHQKKLTEETGYAQKNRLKTFDRVSDVEVAPLRRGWPPGRVGPHADSEPELSELPLRRSGLLL